MSEMRSSVGLSDKAEVEAQALKIAEGLAEGKDVLMDLKDMIEMLKIDVAPTQATIEFLAQEMSFYLGLPSSWIRGDATSGLSDTGKSDAKAVERGLRNYFFSIVKPVLEALFKGSKLTFKTDDVELIRSGLEVLRTMESVGEEFMSKDNKTLMVNKSFGLPPDAKGDEVPEERVEPLNANGQNQRQPLPESR